MIVLYIVDHSLPGFDHSYVVAAVHTGKGLLTPAASELQRLAQDSALFETFKYPQNLVTIEIFSSSKCANTPNYHKADPGICE